MCAASMRVRLLPASRTPPHPHACEQADLPAPVCPYDSLVVAVVSLFAGGLFAARVQQRRPHARRCDPGGRRARALQYLALRRRCIAVAAAPR
eukprot:5889286-Pleurochrysis_carterae.AAC.5